MLTATLEGAGQETAAAAILNVALAGRSLATFLFDLCKCWCHAGSQLARALAGAAPGLHQSSWVLDTTFLAKAVCKVSGPTMSVEG